MFTHIGSSPANGGATCRAQAGRQRLGRQLCDLARTSRREERAKRPITHSLIRSRSALLPT